MRDIWRVLGIEPTDDTKKIRKAYSDKVRECHQEDDPEGWQELHEAYERALKLAGGRDAAGSGTGRMQQGPEDGRQNGPQGGSQGILDAGIGQMRPAKKQGEGHEDGSGTESPDEFEEQFAHIGKRRLEEYAELLKNVEKQLDGLIAGCHGFAENEKRRQEWSDFLLGPEAGALYYNADFWELLGKKLKKSKLTVRIYQTIHKKLVYLRSALAVNAEDETQEALSKTIAICLKRRNTANERYVWAALIGVVLIFYGSTAVNGLVKRYKNAEELTDNALSVCAESLNEKYDTNQYHVTDFTPEKIEGTAIFYSSELKENTTMKKTAGFRMESKADPELEAYVFIIYSQATREAEEFFVFDNLQADAVARDRSERGYDQTPEYAVYCTYYDGKPDAFFEQEETVRYHIKKTYQKLELP